MSSISSDSLHEVLETIKNISSSDVSEAMASFNRYGIVSDNAMDYTRVVYEHGESQLCRKLKEVGFSGEVEVVGKYIDHEGNAYAVYDPTIYTADEALSWLEDHYRSA